MSSVHGLCPSDTKPPSLIPLKKTKSYLFYRRATIPKSACPLFCFLRVEENPNSLSAGPARCIFHLTQNHREFVRGKEMPHRPHRMPGENLSATGGTSQRFWMLFMANNTSYRHCFSLSLGAGVGFLQPFADCGSDVPMSASVTEQNLLTPVPSSGWQLQNSSSGIQLKKCTPPLSLLRTAWILFPLTTAQHFIWDYFSSVLPSVKKPQLAELSVVPPGTMLVHFTGGAGQKLELKLHTKENTFPLPCTSFSCQYLDGWGAPAVLFRNHKSQLK